VIGAHTALLGELWRVWKQEGGAALLARYEDFFTGDAEWCPPMREMTGARYVGREGLEQYIHDLGQVLKELHGELEEIAEIGPDVVRTRVRIHAESKVSQVAIDALMIGMARFRDGRVSLAWASYDPAAAERAEAAILKGEPVPV
jgi:ketosteroid isomerase-like protein